MTLLAWPAAISLMPPTLVGEGGEKWRISEKSSRWAWAKIHFFSCPGSFALCDSYCSLELMSCPDACFAG
jgi:hypothetical protein